MTDSEAWLVLRAQSGDREALEALLDGLQHPLQRYIVRVIGNAAAADDVLQETLMRIYRKLQWLDDPAHLRPWAYRIASREAFRWLDRRQKTLAREADDADLETIAEAPPAFIPEGDVERLAQMLSPASRAVVLLHYQHDLTIAEVAAVLGVAAGTVKSRLAYGLRQLRERTRRDG